MTKQRDKQGWDGWRLVGEKLPGVSYEYRYISKQAPPRELDEEYLSYRLTNFGSLAPVYFLRRFRPTHPVAWVPWVAVLVIAEVSWVFTLGLPISLAGLVAFFFASLLDGVRALPIWD